MLACRTNGQIGHSGSDPGITAFVAFDPVAGTGKLFMMNSEFGDPGEERSARFKAIWEALGPY